MNTAGIIGHSRQIKILEVLRRNDDIPQTILFSGKSGIGKKLVARRLLASLFCEAGDPPCLKCPSCLQAAGGTFPDIIELGPDEKGSIPIGDADRSEPGSVRWLIDRLSKKSISGTYGVLIDGAESISAAGQNALLKTIEEPQAGAHIIIITANRSLILPTILSRCMNLPFYPACAVRGEGGLRRRGHGRRGTRDGGGALRRLGGNRPAACRGRASSRGSPGYAGRSRPTSRAARACASTWPPCRRKSAWSSSSRSCSRYTAPSWRRP